MTKDFEHVKGFCKQDESISSSIFTRDRQYSWLKVTIRRSLDWLLGNCREQAVEGRGIMERNKYMTPNYKEQHRSPKGAQSFSLWSLPRLGETNASWELLGDTSTCFPIVSQLSDIIHFFCLQVLSQPCIYLTVDRRCYLEELHSLEVSDNLGLLKKGLRGEAEALTFNRSPRPVSWLWAIPWTMLPVFQSNTKTHQQAFHSFLETGILQFFLNPRTERE